MPGPGVFERIDIAVEAIRRRGGSAEAAVVLGSGLGDFAEKLADPIVIPYGDLPHWPASTVIGHSGRLVIGRVGGKRVAALAGRVHAYEGRDLSDIVFATRVMGRLGVKQLILTNAAGGVNTGFTSGGLMVIDDHINLQGANPLVGENDERLGPRFPDMTEVYRSASAGSPMKPPPPLACRSPTVCMRGSSDLVTKRRLRFVTSGRLAPTLLECQRSQRRLPRGTWVLKYIGISCISNMAAGVLPEPLNHADVLETTRRVRGAFMALLDGIIERL